MDCIEMPLACQEDVKALRLRCFEYCRTIGEPRPHSVIEELWNGIRVECADPRDAAAVKLIKAACECRLARQASN
jgi:hypothetical protein